MNVEAPVRKRREEQPDCEEHDPNPELQDTGMESYPGVVISESQMNQRDTEDETSSEYPSAFAISVVFGGAVGMSAFSALDLPAGGGFLVGFGCLFTVFLGLALSKTDALGD